MEGLAYPWGQGKDLNLRSPTYEDGELTTSPPCIIKLYKGISPITQVTLFLRIAHKRYIKTLLVIDKSAKTKVFFNHDYQHSRAGRNVYHGIWLPNRDICFTKAFRTFVIILYTNFENLSKFVCTGWSRETRTLGLNIPNVARDQLRYTPLCPP